MSNATYTRPWIDTHIIECEAGIYAAVKRPWGRREPAEPGFEAGMLIDDIRLNLMHGQGVDGAPVEFALKTPSPLVEGRVRDALMLRSSRHSAFRTIIGGFIEDMWSDVVRSGRFVCEVARLLPVVEGAAGEQDGIVVRRVSPEGVMRLWKLYIQRTSEKDRSELGVGRIVHLRAPRFHVFELNGPLRIAPVIAGLRGTDLPESLGLAHPWNRQELYQAGYQFADHVSARDAESTRLYRRPDYVSAASAT